MKFAKKYNYLYKYLYYITIIYTNYKLLTYFLTLNLYKNIYKYQADQLRRLNLKIKYIFDYRNKVADTLSYTLFDINYSKILEVVEAYSKL